MNLSLSLLRIIPLVTLLTGLLLPVGTAKAASVKSTSKASGKKEISKSKEGGKEETGEHHTAGLIPQILLSKKAQQIEFFTFLGLIGCSIVVPEILHKPQKRAGQKQNKNAQAKQNQQQKLNEIEPNLTSLKVISENANKLNLVSDNSKEAKNQEKIELENQSKQNQKTA